MLRWRFATAFIMAPVVLGAIWLGHYAILAVVLLVVARAAQELSRALKPLPFLAALGAGVLPVLLSIPYGSNGALAGAVLSLPWVLVWLAAMPDIRTLRAVLALLLMALWVGAPMAHLGLLWELPNVGTSLPNVGTSLPNVGTSLPDVGTSLVLLAVVGPWVSDAGAYFAGRFFGRHKLFPNLSPKKTYEGAVGGLLLSVAVIGPFAYYFLGFGAVEAALLGLVISTLSQAGDLFESILKRLLQLKDLGRALPGHGGILDRIDSLLFTAPAIFYLYILFIP